MENKNFSRIVSQRALDLLTERKAMLFDAGTVFWAWPRDDRLVLIFDPRMIDLRKVNDEFAHYLSTRLQGRRVVRTNSRGLYLQIGYKIPPALVDLVSRPLDLRRQPSPYHLPIGMVPNGSDLWISLYDGDSFLVSGTRGMGKTVLLHAWTQAMLSGGAVDVYAYDGKAGAEFARYIGQPHYHMVHDLNDTLARMLAIANERRLTLIASGHPNTRMYNDANPKNALRPIVLIVDEAALTTEEQKRQLIQIVERERATGFYPILATNRPEASALLVKSNLITRISFAVPSWNASHMALGQTGAEALSKTPGRGLIVFQARVQEFQGFTVTLPDPTPEAVQYILDRERMAITQPTAAVNELTQLAESIREDWNPSLSKRATAAMLGKTYAGSSAAKIDQIIEILGATTTTSVAATSDFGLNTAG